MSAAKRRSKSRKSTYNYRIIFILGILLAAAFLLGAFILYQRSKSRFSGNNPQTDDGKMEQDLLRLSEETYEAALVSMHAADYFTEEDFLFYGGLNALVASHRVLDTEELSQYLECILNSGNALSHLYLCLDPELLWTTAGKEAAVWNANLEQDLYSHLTSYPEITFSFLLPYPYIGYWLELGEDKLDTLLTLYHALVNELYRYPNVRVFFPGAEPWLTLNPANYTDTLFDANEIITRSIYLHTFCDGDYLIYPENAEGYWNTLRETIAREKTAPTCYADLSDWCFVFFGDSVLGNYPGSFSIPGYVNGLSGALTCNFAVGGTPAAYEETDVESFPVVIDRFLTENVTASDGESHLLFEGYSPEELADKKLCFLINYGFNDYFAGNSIENPNDPGDITTFKGSLRTCISRLRSAFPDARILLMTPTHTQSFGGGTAVNGDNGNVFSAYIDALTETAAEMGLFLLDNYKYITTEEDMIRYLADGVHPNENGRLVIADRIVRFVDLEMR